MSALAQELMHAVMRLRSAVTSRQRNAWLARVCELSELVIGAGAQRSAKRSASLSQFQQVARGPNGGWR